jgi:hypothetical protein
MRQQPYVPSLPWFFALPLRSTHITHSFPASLELAEEWFSAGFHHITNVDISSVLIKQLQAHYHGTPHAHTPAAKPELLLAPSSASSASSATSVPSAFELCVSGAQTSSDVRQHIQKTLDAAASSASASGVTQSTAAPAPSSSAASKVDVKQQPPSTSSASSASSASASTASSSTSSGLSPPKVMRNPFADSPTAASGSAVAAGGMRYLTADARALPFATASFDVVIDKGTIDAVVCHGSADVHLIVSECARYVLSVRVFHLLRVTYNLFVCA